MTQGPPQEGMKLTLEVSGHRLVIREEDLEHFGLSVPSEIISERNADGWLERELGQTHISLTGIFKRGARPAWEEIK